MAYCSVRLFGASDEALESLEDLSHGAYAADGNGGHDSDDTGGDDKGGPDDTIGQMLDAMQVLLETCGNQKVAFFKKVGFHVRFGYTEEGFDKFIELYEGCGFLKIENGCIQAKESFKCF